MGGMVWALCHLALICCFIAKGGAAELEQRESSVAATAMSPPEWNTTFVGGRTWCVALPGVPLSDLQLALDWACGTGSADCAPVQPGRECFMPDTLLSHASYAFNSYYQQNGNSDIACNFGGIDAITRSNPSYGACKYPTSEPSSALPAISMTSSQWKLVSTVLLLLYF